MSVLNFTNEGKMESEPKKNISMNGPAFSTGKDIMKILYDFDTIISQAFKADSPAT